MKKLLSIFLLLACLSASAQNRIQATITITNSPYPTNGAAFVTVNGDQRNFTNATPAVTNILEDPSLGGCATNFFNSVSVLGFTGPLILAQPGSNVITLYGGIGQAMSVTVSANLASVTYYTNTVTPGAPVIVPLSSEPNAARAISNANGIIAGLNAYATATLGIALFPSIVMTNNGNGFTMSNICYIYPPIAGSSTQPMLTVQVASSLHQKALQLQDSTGGVAYLFNALSGISGDHGTWSTDGNGNFTVVSVKGNIASATNAAGLSPLFSYSATANDGTGLINVTAALATNVAPNITLTNEILTTPSIQSGAFSGTNYWTGDIAYTGVGIGGLANGNNADLFTSTYTYIRLSGPTAAFAIVGISGGRDGREIMLENTTGYTLTIANASGLESVSSNRILTGVNANITTTNNPGLVHLIYSGATSKWEILSCSN